MPGPLTRSGLVSSLLWAAAYAQATQLFVSSYSGNVTTLSLDGDCDSDGGGIPRLRAVSQTGGCAGSPSFLTLDQARSTLYCVDEGLQTGNSSLSSFTTNADGSLKRLDRKPALTGPVFGGLYGNSRGLAVAHFGGEAITTWDVSNPSQLKLLETKRFKLDKPGPREEQKVAKPHETFVDPTGKFLVVPDLGGDLVRLFAFGSDGLSLTALDAVPVAAGSGPRHVGFAVKDSKTFMYVVTELASSIVGFEATYSQGAIKMRELWTIGVHGEPRPREVTLPPPLKEGQAPQQAFASEIVVSQDNKHAIVSSRNENSLTVDNFDANNSTKIPSDPLINFSIADNGSLNKTQEVASGGRFPRHFSMNKAGTLLAVGLQNDGRVATINRNPQTGALGGFAGFADVEGQVTCVVFNE